MSGDSTDELFDEASNELKQDIVEAVTDAEESLVGSEDMWDVDADNILGVVNGLKQDLDPDTARESYTEARKWFVLATEAGALSDEAENVIGSRLDELESTLGEMDSVLDALGDLTPLLPSVHDSLSTFESEPGDTVIDSGSEDESDDDSSSDSDEDEPAESDDEDEQEGDKEEDEGEDDEEDDGSEDDETSESGGSSTGVSSWGSDSDE